MCGQSWKVSEDGAMEEDEGFGLWIWGLLEVIDVAGGAETTEDGGTRRGGNGLALGAGGDFAVVADADAGMLAPDKGPPGTRRGGTEDGAFFGEGLSFGGVGGGAELAVDFVLVDVREELVKQAVGPFEFKDLVGSEKRGGGVSASSHGGVRFCLWLEGLGRSGVGRRRSGELGRFG